MIKLKVPKTPIIDDNGNLSAHWDRFFQNIVDRLRIQIAAEIGLGREETNGNWRIIQSSDDLIFQQRESGTWVTKDTISGA